MATTILSDLINPEVMADSISAELPAKIAARGFMKVNTDLSGRPGDTLTVPRYNYVGPAVDLAEGEAGDVDALTTNEAKYTVKKAVKNIELTDESILSGFGDPIGETSKQLRLAIQDKVDNDAIYALENDAGIYRVTTSGVLSYEVIAEAMSAFADEEQGIDTFLLVSQEGMRQLRADSRLIGNELLDAQLIHSGVVGVIAGANIVISNKLNGVNDSRKAFLLKREAMTAFLKRDVSLETSRDVLRKKTLISADQHYFVGIEDANKIIGINHTNAYLGRLSCFSKVTAHEGSNTYDVTVSSIYPGKFTDNTLKYKIGTSMASIAYNDVLTTGWTTISGSTFTASDVPTASGVIMVAQVLTADNKAKYFGAAKVI
jgi:N4-gp56 family major capsid protein